MENAISQRFDSGSRKLTVTFPNYEAGTISQDEEWCLLSEGGEERRIRFHDYHEIYAVPGLYEHIFYERLKCRSPQIIGSLLGHEAARLDLTMADLRVLDVGAGNGIMGEVLADTGAEEIVGVDILPEAEAAARRDRPQAYTDYFTTDLTDMSWTVRRQLEARDFNCMTLVAALGFGDIPPEVFSVAYNLVQDGGLVAFNIKHEFLTGEEDSEFSLMINRMIEKGWFQPNMRLSYAHRNNIAGEPLFYDALVGTKVQNIPDNVLS